MTVRELREKFLRFYESKGHSIYPSGSLIPVDVTGRLDESLLFNGAGMIQFKPYFRGVATPPNKRLTTAQKCVRTGDIEEVGDLTHLTFFEMLGNFSFGDYFKEDAVAFTWEFLTSKDWLGLDPQRLSFTVFEDDEEALGHWTKWLGASGIDPANRVFRLGEESNYWPAGAFSNGPPGPCGPNSEFFYWVSNDVPPPSGAYSRDEFVRDEAEGKWLEIGNDVFIMYEWQGKLRNPERPAEGYVKEGMPDLPFRSIDTGSGLERNAAVLGGLKSVYDTDAFQPILRVIEEIAGDYKYGSNERKDKAARIIADHIRTACFCIADGINPENTGRGYVLRRLIRRAILKGQRVMGFREPFFHRVYDGVVEAMGDHYKELTERKEVIVETLRNEEDQFRRTLAAGSNMLQDEIDRLKTEIRGQNQLGSEVRPVLAGDVAFKLYDTYGFPLEVTRELSEEAGIHVDEEGYEDALKLAQERSRAGSSLDTVYGGVKKTFVELFGEALKFVEKAYDETVGKPTPTSFKGYDQAQTQSRIVGALPEEGATGTVGGNLVIALDETPFYAESGGQVSDTGMISGGGFEGRVVDVVRQNGVFVHAVEPTMLPFRFQGESLDEARELVQKKLYNTSVEATVDVPRRRSIMRNHTATHLLHAALRQTLGKHVTQAGSYVGPDRLRFDFTHGKAMTPEELATVERIVNERVLDNLPVVTYVDLPIADAKAMGAMALFGEKYGEFVRLVQVGPEPPNQVSFSRELCGGTHVRQTGEIGLFKIASESSAASGVRRIEAITGEGSYAWVLEQMTTIHEAANKLRSTPKDLLHAIDKALETQRDLKQRLEKARTQTVTASAAQVQTVGSVELAVEKLLDTETKDATMAADKLAENAPNRVVLVAATFEGKVSFVCKVGTDALAKGANAGALVRELAKITGGGGGGRPDFATAGGKDPSKLDEALGQTATLLQGMLRS